MDMILLHANRYREDVGEVKVFTKFDAQLKKGGTLEENSFALTVPEGAWAQNPIHEGGFVYIDGTEWGGPVDLLTHSTSGQHVILEGPLWRGLLMQRVIEPPAGQTHRVVGPMDANAALETLRGNAFDGLFTVEAQPVGVQVSGQYRYTTLLDAMEHIAGDGLRVRVTYSAAAKRATIAAVPVGDYTNLIDLSQDYDIHLQSTLGRMERYNHVIALGRGEMLDRMVRHLYRLADGTVVRTCPEGWNGADERVVTYDNSMAESEEALIKGASERLAEYGRLESMEMDTGSASLALQIGDRVSARDRLTGLEAVATVTEMILTIDGNKAQIQTKVG